MVPYSGRERVSVIPLMVGGKPANAKNPQMRRNAAYMVSDLKLWKFSVVFQFRCSPENRAHMSTGAKSRSAYFLYQGRLSVVLVFFFLLKMDGRSGRKLL